MVKRTLVVLGIFSLILMTAGPTMAQMHWPMSPFGQCFGPELFPKPLFVPVDCPAPIQRNIVKTWECKIVGPCPAPTPGGACGPGLAGRDDRMGLLTSFATAIASPFDMIFGGMDGVYGCQEMANNPCGSPFPGPIPVALRSLVYFWYPTDGSFFGGLW